MALLSPALLWLLATAPILLFFYVWRARHKRFVAPSVLLWQKAIQETEHRASWRLPIRHILLLLELLALALLGLSLARPAVSVGVPHRTIVLLDASVQMTAADVNPAARVLGSEQVGRAAPVPLVDGATFGARRGPLWGSLVSRFAAAQATIQRMIDNLAPADSLTLIRVGATARFVLTSGDHAALSHALAGLRPDMSTPAMSDGLLVAQSVAAQTQAVRTSLVVMTARQWGGGTDPARGPLWGSLCGAPRQRSGVGTHLPPVGVFDDEARGGESGQGTCRVLRFGMSDDDQAVTNLSATCPAAGSTGDCSVFARIFNYGPRSVSEPVALYADGLPLPLAAQDSRYLVPARSNLDVIFSAPRQARTVELTLGRHDIISADDRRWAILPHPGMRSILIVSDEPSLLDRAVHALPNVAVTDITSGQYTDSAALAADVTIYDSWLPDNGPSSNALVINPPQGGSYLPYDHAMSNPTVASIEVRNNLAGTLLGGVDLRALVVGSAPALTLPAWAQPLVASNDGPLIFAGTRAPDPGTSSTGLGSAPRVVVIGFAIAAPSSNLSRLVAFPLLLEHAIDWLSGTPGDLTTSQAAGLSPDWGSALPLTPRRGASGVTVYDPAMHRVPLPASPVDGAPIFVAQGSPGDYLARQNGPGLAAADQYVAVNASVAVAGQAAGTGAPAGASTPSWDAALATGVGAGVAHLIARQEIWWAFVLAVLAVLSLEWWIYARRS